MRGDVVRAIIDAMLNCEARGDYRTMRGHIKWSAAHVIENGDEAAVKELPRLLVRVIAAIDKEAESGDGTLLNPGHADNIAWTMGKWLPFKMATHGHIEGPL